MHLTHFLKQQLANRNLISTILRKKPFDMDIKIQGWVKSRMKMKKFNFIKLDDGNSLERLQVVVPAKLITDDLNYHSCIQVKGKLVKSPGKMQSVELLAEELKVLSKGAPPDFPFKEGCDFDQEDLRLVPHFRPRTKEFASMLRVRSETKMNIIRHLTQEGFTMVDTPCLTLNNFEGSGEAFAVKAGGKYRAHENEANVEDGVFKCPTFLTVSGQLHLEECLSSCSKVFNFNPAFRVNATSRMHLHEFYMVELEEIVHETQNIAMDDLVNRAEYFLKWIVKKSLDSSLSDLQIQWKYNKNDKIEKLLTDISELKPFTRMTFSEALEILKSHGIDHPEGNINRASEFFLVKHCGNKPVFITEWPTISKPFYAYRKREDDKFVMAFDLLVPGVGELIGGSLREYDPNLLTLAMTEANMLPVLNWYLKTKLSNRPSGGFGMGFERFLQLITGSENIRDTIPFPRHNFDCNI